MATIEELLRQLLQGQNGSPATEGRYVQDPKYGPTWVPGTPAVAGTGGNNPSVALEDPEYQLDLSQLQGQQGEAEADYLAQQAETQARYERVRRAAERQLPKDITNIQELAAGRGMYHAGGRIETEGRLNQQHADTLATTAEQQTSELNSLLRNLTSRRNETQRGISAAQQNAAQRALERARQQSLGVATPVAGAPAGAAPRAHMVNGRWVDINTGRPAYYGPNGEPGYARAEDDKSGLAKKQYRMPDGRIVYYR